MQTLSFVLLHFIAPLLFMLLIAWRIKDFFMLFDKGNDKRYIIFLAFNSIFFLTVGTYLRLFLLRPTMIGYQPSDVERLGDFKGIGVFIAFVCLCWALISTSLFIAKITYLYIAMPLYKIAAKFMWEKIYDKMAWEEFFTNHNSWFHFKFYFFDRFETHENILKYSVYVIFPFLVGLLGLKFSQPELYQIILKSNVLLLQIINVTGDTHFVLWFLRVWIFAIYAIVLYNLSILFNAFYTAYFAIEAIKDYYLMKHYYSKGNYHRGDVMYQNLMLYFKDNNFLEEWKGKIEFRPNEGYRREWPEKIYKKDFEMEVEILKNVNS